MADEEVWVQLYIGNDKSGGAFPIEIASLRKDRIHDLAKAVYEAKDKSLGHCDAADLLVYKAGTDFPAEGEAPLGPGKAVPTGTTDENPLVVVAPAPAPHPPPAQKQQQRLAFCRTWSSEGNHLPYNLLANSYDDLKRQASHKFKFDADKVTLYYIPNKN